MKSWNCWTIINGTLYGWRAYHPDDFLLQLQGANINPRLVYAYGGKTIQRWETRMEQHAWGGGRYDSQPQPWADTVPGWTPNGTVDDLIAAGGVFIIWQGRTVPLLLSWGEILIAIKLKRPVYNYSWNLGNPRRIPIPEAENQRELRDAVRAGIPAGGAGGPRVRARTRPRSKSRSGTGSVAHAAAVRYPLVRRVSNIRLWVGYYRKWLALAILAGLLVLFWPGMPGADAVAAVRDWFAQHRAEIVAVLVLVLVLLIGGPRMLRPRRRSSRRRRSQTRRRR